MKALQLETVVNISHLSTAVSLDVASEYFLGQEKSTGELVEPGKQFTELLKKALPMNNWKTFPLLMAVIASLPDWLVMKTNPGVVELLTWKGRLSKTEEVLDETLSAGHLQPTKDRTIIHDLVASNLPPDEKPPHCLVDEANQPAYHGGGLLRVTPCRRLVSTFCKILQCSHACNRNF
jgi:hypothetical protein